MNFCVMYGSHREPRVGIRLAKYIIKQLEMRGHHVDFIDSRELKLPVLEKRYIDYPAGKVPKKIEEISQTLYAADGFIMIAGEYNHSMQPGLKNMIDIFGKEYFFRPSAIAVYSPSDFGGVRSEIALLPTLCTLHMPPIPATLIVPKIDKAMSEDAVPLDETLDKRCARFLNQLEWYARALKAEREKGLPK